ncbi:MAG: hypothetical protein JWO58_662 [Chitinophagaceae bacterium]|nr:hypothetical protein [Chitinophagaceae bacterium]
MELSGKIVQLLALQKGDGKNGGWKKQEFVIETSGNYPKKVCFSLWGDKIDQSPLSEGTAVKVSFDVESREYNGKWYTDAKAWKVEADNGSSPSRGGSSDDSYPAGESFSAGGADELNDLPF